MSASLQNVAFYYPAAYDVVIDEILADPSPPVLLPETEYLEVTNTTNKNISLFGWQIMVNSRRAILPKKEIGSGEYRILLDAISAPDFQNQNDIVIGIEGFPTLSNEGADIVLLDATGRLMNAVDYNINWYNTETKKEGGWSLEMINPKEPCTGKENWKESVDYRGGTPGEINSVYSGILSNKTPKLWRAAVTDSGSLMLYFSEPMDSLTLALTNFYYLDHEIGLPVSVRPNWKVADKVELFFNKPFEKLVEYKISLSSDPCDCMGLSIGSNQSARFRVSEQADSSDIVVNEIMFDPKQNFEEYVELYNQSNKTIDIKDWQLISGDSVNKGKVLTNDYFPMAPKSYVVLSKDYSGINSEEEFEHAELIVKMSDLPILSNEGSKIIIMNKQGKCIDAAAYLPTYHHPLLSDTKGVSLERISAKVSGLDRSNWQSASSDAGYQTPAASNSQSELLASANHVTINPQTITPNADGIDDELSVCYQMDEPGYMARIFVFDKDGDQMSSLANGKILGTDGCYNFQGKDERGNTLTAGIYILYFEAYNKSGKRFVTKKAFVVGD